VYVFPKTYKYGKLFLLVWPDDKIIKIIGLGNTILLTFRHLGAIMKNFSRLCPEITLGFHEEKIVTNHNELFFMAIYLALHCENNNFQGEYVWANILMGMMMKPHFQLQRPFAGNGKWDKK
jgi:hypothetical protein